ncbi:MAG: hypothetical protein LBD18_01135 [Treponema sp.]|jgi:hypothetical protein|nr:hypothetical protein [Treponema sp.]
MGEYTVNKSADRGSGDTLHSMREIIGAAADALNDYGGTVTAFKIMPGKKRLKLTVSFDTDIRLWTLAPKVLPAGDNADCGKISILSRL